MAEKMLKFVSVPQAMPEKRKASERKADFGEIYSDYSDERAREQSSRCSQCGIPFCSVNCPLGNNIPDWLRLTAEERLEEAYEISQATNNFPEITGRICPQDRLCEGNCVIEKGFDSVTIGSVEKYITDTAWEKGWVKPATPVRELDLSVAIIGAGPAGLAAADEMRKMGYQVHVYDRYDRVGGLMVYGIPSFKLEKEVVQRRAQLLEDAGVTFHLNFEVGRDATLKDLREKHDAVLIATGVYKARALTIPGVGLGGVYPAMTYLTASNKVGLGDDVPEFNDGSLNAAGKNVIVIGGGDTAMDCVRTAIRQGAKSVRCLYRRDRENMPGSVREVQNAEEEGVEFDWLTAPKAFLGDKEVNAVRIVNMRLGPPDPARRRRPQPIPDSDQVFDCDMVIKALGFDPEDIPQLFGEPGLEVSRWGTVKINLRTMMTNIEGVFAGGDIVRGASLVVWGIRDGRDVARQMHKFLSNKAARETAPAAKAS